MKKIHLLPNAITAFGLSCGLFIIFKMNMTPLGQITEQVLTATACILLLAAFADLLDGAVARVIKAESDFGGLFDSLSDAVTFGVGPSVITLKSLSIAPGTEYSFLLTTSAMVYSVCGILRLVRFNVHSKNAKGNLLEEEAQKKNFTGLPIPAAAAAAVSVNLLLISEDFKNWWEISETARIWTLFFVMTGLGYFMISRWKFPSLKSLHVKVTAFQLVASIVLLAAFIFYGILHHFSLVFFGISWSYVLIAWILSLTRLITGKKIKTLEGFEPEPDDEED